MRNALILHGTDATPHDNWFPWLKHQLEEKHWNVWAPTLPEADHPNLHTYLSVLLQNPNWKYNPDTILIGHSSGAVAILGLLQHLPENVVVDSCFLVGAFKDDLGWEKLRGLFLEPFQFEKIRHHAKRFLFIHSDTDPYCPLEGVYYLAQQLKGKVLLQKGQGHFNTEQSEQYRQFPFLLEQIEKISS